MIREYFEEFFQNKAICLLGFGREGKSTLRILLKFSPSNQIIIADQNPETDSIVKNEFGHQAHLKVVSGENYYLAILMADIIIKSPGISFKSFPDLKVLDGKTITSQTELFLRLFRSQVIGVTGTKGKSTTVTLLYHIFKTAGNDVLLVGNIGIPPFDIIENIRPETIIVFEMSSHQLENSTVSPSVAVLLNIFQEHLDHYPSYRDYQLAKLNIGRWQLPGDFFIYNSANSLVDGLITEFMPQGSLVALNHTSDDGSFVRFDGNDLIINTAGKRHVLMGLAKNRQLMGQHNLINIAAAGVGAYIMGVDLDVIAQAVSSFKGLPHRLERVGIWNGITFCNDSISTIPEATIEALKTIGNVQTLLLGGYDRGIDYHVLTSYLLENPIQNLLMIGAAGSRMMELFSAAGVLHNTSLCEHYNDFDAAVNRAVEVTKPNYSCLLSPAAASYDMFKNFEARGEKFRQIILSLKDVSAC